MLQVTHQQVTCLCLLDLSAAFDVIDHSIPLSLLSLWFGINGTALDWFNSCNTYKTGRFERFARDSRSTQNRVSVGDEKVRIANVLSSEQEHSPVSPTGARDTFFNRGVKVKSRDLSYNMSE